MHYLNKRLYHFRLSFSDLLLFLFFFTLHADRLRCSCFGYTVRLNNGLALLALGYFVLQWRIKAFSLRTPLFRALLFFSLALLLSALCSVARGRCLLFFSWYLFTLLAYLFFPYFLMQTAQAERALKIYFSSFLLVGIYACLQLLASLVGFHDPFATQTLFEKNWVRPNAFCYEPSYYILYMLPFVLLINFCALTKCESPLLPWKRVKIGPLIYANLFFLIAVSTSAVFAYLIFFASYLVATRRHINKRLFFALIFIALLSTVGFFSFPSLFQTYYFKFFRSDFMAHHSFFERWVMIRNAWLIFLRHPLLGIGLGAIPSYLYEACIQGDSDFFFALPADFSFAGVNSLKFFEPSNVLTELMASTGLVGLAAFAYLLLCVKGEFKNRLKEPFILGLALSLLIQLIVLQFNQGLLRTYVWTHLGLVLGYLTKTSRSSLQDPLLKGEAENLVLSV
jgi:hypothetical protein